jgi:GTP-binding protein Era
MAKPRKTQSFRAGRIAILGRPNVGKSTLLNALVGEKIAIVSPQPQTTRDPIAGILTTGAAQLVFVDTPGLHQAKTRLGARMNQIAREVTHGCDLVFFLTDAGPTSMRDADLAILREIPAKTPVILVVTKVDKVKDKSKLFPILEEHAKAREFAAVVPLSPIRAAAGKDGGLAALVREATELLPEGEKLFVDDELSDKPARFFASELVREQILHQTRQEVPHGVATTVERFDESGKMAQIGVTVHVDKESHKKIVIGEKGARIKAIGTEARKRIEELLGKRVHLELWVKVTPRWYESDARMKELGYEPGTAR